jgi:ketosteroid isomerase-like protein
VTGYGAESGAKVVRRLHEAFNRRDREALLRCLARDVAWHVGGDHPLAGSFYGRDALWEGALEPLWASPARVEDHAVLEHGEHVVALAEWFHDFGDGEQGWKGVEVFRLADGQVAERREFTSHQTELDGLFTRGCPADAGPSS